MKIENKFLLLNFSEKFASYELSSKIFPDTKFRGSFEINCMFDGKETELIEDFWSISQIEHLESVETNFGVIEVENLKIETEFSEVKANIRIGLEKHKNMAFIQLEVINNTSKSIFVDKLTPLIIKNGDLALGSSSEKEYRFYSNGWQSWSSTGTFRPGDRQHTSIIGKFQNPQIYNPGTPFHKDRTHFSGDMFGVLCEIKSRIGLLSGFLSQKRHFGSLETSLESDPGLKLWANGDRARLDPGQGIITDWACLSFVNLEEHEPLKTYLEMVADEHKIKLNNPVPVGWCSWYHFYQKISQKEINDNLQSIIELQEKVPLTLVQIDDGFETYPGDWFDFVPGFPDGVKPLAKEILNADLIPGLWLAPFIIHPKSRLVKEHPDWLLRDERGKLVSAGFVWDTFNYALDITHPEAIAYARKVIHTAVNDWGFKYLKLDFLYAAALKGQYKDPTKTRAQALRSGLEVLREAAGEETVMLACGCPLGSALGLFDAMRIGADVSGHWEPHFPPFSGLLKNEVNMPSARNALQNILTRAPLHRRWWINDPDCLLVRPETELSLEEVQSLATAISLTGGSLLVSDDLPNLPEDRLRIAQVMLPVIDQRAFILDLFENAKPSIIRLDLKNCLGTWHLLAYFNWEDKTKSLEFSHKKFHLPDDQIYWYREFWTGQIGKMESSIPFQFNDVPKHGVRVIAARPFQANQPTYLGSDIHFSQGLEVNHWVSKDRHLSFNIELGRKANGPVYLYLPWPSLNINNQDKSYKMKKEAQDIYSISLTEFNGKKFHIMD